MNEITITRELGEQIKKMIPFTFTDHYDVIYINCKDEKILSQSAKRRIDSLKNFIDLSEYKKKYLIKMIKEGLTEYCNWT